LKIVEEKDGNFLKKLLFKKGEKLNQSSKENGESFRKSSKNIYKIYRNMLAK
jgi:hypothetical protein